MKYSQAIILASVAASGLVSAAPTVNKYNGAASVDALSTTASAPSSTTTGITVAGENQYYENGDKYEYHDGSIQGAGARNATNTSAGVPPADGKPHGHHDQRHRQAKHDVTAGGKPHRHRNHHRQGKHDATDRVSADPVAASSTDGETYPHKHHGSSNRVSTRDFDDELLGRELNGTTPDTGSGNVYNAGAGNVPNAGIGSVPYGGAANVIPNAGAANIPNTGTANAGASRLHLAGGNPHRHRHQRHRQGKHDVTGRRHRHQRHRQGKHDATDRRHRQGKHDATDRRHRHHRHHQGTHVGTDRVSANSGAAASSTSSMTQPYNGNRKQPRMHHPLSHHISARDFDFDDVLFERGLGGTAQDADAGNVPNIAAGNAPNAGAGGVPPAGGKPHRHHRHHHYHHQGKDDVADRVSLGSPASIVTTDPSIAAEKIQPYKNDYKLTHEHHLNARQFEDYELEAREFEDNIEVRNVQRDFIEDFELNARDFGDYELDARGFEIDELD